MTMDQGQWYQQQEDWFRQQYYKADHKLSGPLQHSGWLDTDATEHPAWRAFLSLIDRPGTILDLGCGNGALLRALVDNSPYALTPYGIDFLAESIDEACTLILPEFRNNFLASNVAHFDFSGQTFSYIITSPAYVHPDAVASFIQLCYQHLEPLGRLILYEYSAVAVLPNYQTLIDHSGLALQGQLITSPAVRIVQFQRFA